MAVCRISAKASSIGVDVGQFHRGEGEASVQLVFSCFNAGARPGQGAAAGPVFDQGDDLLDGSEKQNPSPLVAPSKPAPKRQSSVTETDENEPLAKALELGRLSDRGGLGPALWLRATCSF
jgi:hypothetical protein